MIDKVSQLPNDIAVEKPVPGKGRFQEGMPFKQANAISDGANGKIPGNEAVKDVDQKGHLIVFHLKVPV